MYARHRISHGGLKGHLLERTANDDFRRVFQSINIKYYQSPPIMGLLRDNKQIIIIPMEHNMALSCKHEILKKKLANCSPYFTTLQYINNLETQQSYKMMVNLENLKFLKSVSSGLKIIPLFVM